MVRKKLDNRIRLLIENGVAKGHRSLFAIVGDNGRDQVVTLHHIFSKAVVAARPSVLWCYKKELGFTTHRRKRMKEVQKKIKAGKLNIREDDPFELFISSTQIRYCYYSETHKILGNTFGMVVLQDFEALTPNLLARTIETVEGGGLVIILLRSVTSLRQLYTMAMPLSNRVAQRRCSPIQRAFHSFSGQLPGLYRVGRSIEHFADFLKCRENRGSTAQFQELTAEEIELRGLVESMHDTQPIGGLIKKCKTLCQAKVLLQLLDVITEKTLRATCSVTAARGRGKSAALGLAVAGAIGFGYSNIFVTSPSPENLKTLFEFIAKGFDVMDYQEHMDYELFQSTNPEFNKAVIRVNVFRDHRQTIQYIHPTDAMKLGQAELVVIDEAAAIPLPLVKQLMGPYLVFLASTINGYEGTGRSLSLKLIQQLREQMSSVQPAVPTSSEKGKPPDSSSPLVPGGGRQLFELTMTESIRYKPGDKVESWLNRVLCLDATSVHRLISGTPPPTDCDLYYVNRDTLFSFHKASEAFLQRLMSIYVSAHYKNTPNDLQMLSDAPSHHLFVLMGPVKDDQEHLPEALVVLQVCIEGEISRSTVHQSMQRGKRASGDLIPWTISQQFQDSEFPSLCGARIVRIAVHPDYQSMGYGSRALEILRQYFEGEVPCLNEEATSSTAGRGDVRTVQDADTVGLLDEKLTPRADLPPLLQRLSERTAETLDYLGVSFGLTLNLLKFWKRCGYAPVYLRQTTNDLTGEHTCIMLKRLRIDESVQDWLRVYWCEFRKRLVSLLAYEFSKFTPHLAMSLLQNKTYADGDKLNVLSRTELAIHMSNSDLRRLEQYARNMIDHHLVTDLLPVVARLFFTSRVAVEHCKLNAVQSAVLLGMGLQHKSIDQISEQLGMEVNQLLAMFNKAVRKFSDHFNSLCERAIETEFNNKQQQPTTDAQHFQPTKMSLQDDLNEASIEFKARQQRDRERLKDEIGTSLKQFTIRGSEDDWSSALNSDSKLKSVKPGGIVSVKSERQESRGTANALEQLDKEMNTDKNAHRKRKRKSFRDQFT